MALVSHRTQVQSLDHLKELADYDRKGCHIDLMKFVGFIDGLGNMVSTREILYDPEMNTASERHWSYSDEDGQDGYFTDQDLWKETDIPESISQGQLYVDDRHEVDIFIFAYDEKHNLERDVYQEVQELIRRNEFPLYSTSHWEELLIPASKVECLYILRDNTIIVFLKSGEALHFSEQKEVNYPAQVPWFEWVKVYTPQEKGTK